MKNLINLLMAISLLFAFGCEKHINYPADGTSTIMVVNGAVDLSSAQVNMESMNYYYKTAPKIGYGSGAFSYAYKRPTLFRAVNALDSTKFIVDRSFDFSAKAYTLYMIGQVPTVEPLLVEENAFPFINQQGAMTAADSVVNVRFVNLSPNSVPLKVNIKGSTASEVSSLSYKDVGGFKGYSAKTVPTAYIFEVRNQTTDALLLTYTFSATATNRFKNVSLLIRGLMGTTTGTNALGISAINYF